ncbi:3-isopropylmalate dehydratase large subunit [Gemmatimonas sp.]|uniref:3-isopropylmalate dehydratase large subunit n=1 Tax=Gemmatimonas sp. TaxID=1962908 RepID=UPI0035623617
MSAPRTLFEKVWDAHVVRAGTAEAPAVLYVDLHLVHEVTSPQAFTALRERGLRVHRPDRTVATMDHSTPTVLTGGRLAVTDAAAGKQLDALAENCADFGVPMYGMDDERRGIVHVIGPELGRTQPGMTIVCGDSHTSTHGAFGALAFGIGTSEVGHVLATQCLLQSRPKTMEVRVDGALAPGVSAKDLILAIIAQIGVSGGTGHVIEYRGEVIRALDMEGRMTVCNMSIEAGARAGMIAPDETTFAWLAGREFSPTGAAWEAAVTDWRTLHTDSGAHFDRRVIIDASTLAPMITWGTNPGMAIAVDAQLPDTSSDKDPALARAYAYMGLEPGQRLLGQRVDVVFIGSCTNGRIDDLRAAAGVLRGRRVAANTRMLVVPGSQRVKRQAEREGLADIFRAAGAEWRESGCSMCIAMNGDTVGAGQYAVSTSNRNFEGRQGKGARTLLASPLTAAASAVAGAVADPRSLL